MDVKEQIRKFTWRIENFSSIVDEELYSESFIVDGIKWELLIYPGGECGYDMSIYLEVADPEILPSGWSTFAQFGLAVIYQNDRKTSITEVSRHMFKAAEPGWGYPSFLLLSELHNPKRGYLVNDACLIEAYVSTDWTRGLISHDLIVQADSDEHKIKEADRMDVESEEPTEEDMKTFFTRLESEFSSLNIVYSQEEAKEAVAKLDEALNMTLVKFYDSGEFSALKKAFKILASFDHSSTILTAEQKDRLVAMEKILKELASRAGKVVQDKNVLAAMESSKLTITRKLDCNLVRYKEVEQKLAALLAERNEIFRSSKKMKMKLEAFGKEWAEMYEAKAKVVEEEEKTVEAEWESMKGFITSIKGKI